MMNGYQARAILVKPVLSPVTRADMAGLGFSRKVEKSFVRTSAPKFLDAKSLYLLSRPIGQLVGQNQVYTQARSFKQQFSGESLL